MSPNAIESDCSDFTIGDADLRVNAPAVVLETLDRMLRHVPRSHADVAAPLRIDVRIEDKAWRIAGHAPKSVKALGGHIAMPQLAGAIVASMLAETAYHRGLHLWRGAVVEREGAALALVGDDWESAVTLTAHLHTRGWRIVAGDYALVSRKEFIAYPFRKSLHVNSSSLVFMPNWYRAAIEASPWYATADVIAFYAIDPTLIDQRPAWGERAPIRAVVKVDGRMAEQPTLETGEEFRLEEHLHQGDLIAAGIEVAMLTLGNFVETCDFLERWFGTLPSRLTASHDG